MSLMSYFREREEEAHRRKLRAEYKAGNIEAENTLARKQAALKLKEDEFAARQAIANGKVDTDKLNETARVTVEKANALLSNSEALLKEKELNFAAAAKLVNDAADARVKAAEKRAETAEKMLSELMARLPKVDLTGGLNVNVKSSVCKE